jgi:hypothetical protein
MGEPSVWKMRMPHNGNHPIALQVRRQVPGKFDPVRFKFSHTNSARVSRASQSAMFSLDRGSEGDEMIEMDEPYTLAENHTSIPPLSDRRRPGRIESCPPSLISLLREPTLPVDHDFDDDGLRPSRGIAAAVLLSFLFWVPVFLILR